MSEIKRYLVGGAVRDELLGIQSKDRDYVVVAPSFSAMREWLLHEGHHIYLEKEEFGVIRSKLGREDADHVLARKDGPYGDGRRPDYVEPGTLEDDLRRRDFTVNALAKAEDGTIIDLFEGREDLRYRVLDSVGDPRERFLEDALRVFRAVRFMITKDFVLSHKVKAAIHNVGVLDKVEEVSVERIREELHRCFAHDTVRTVSVLANEFPELLGVMARKGIWLIPSNKEKK